MPWLCLFDEDSRPVLGLQEHFGVGENLSDDVHRARSTDLLAPAGRRRAEEDAEGMAWRPISQISRGNDFSCPLLFGSFDRNGKIDLFAPEITSPFDRQGLPDQLGCLRLVEFCLDLDLSCLDPDPLAHRLLLFRRLAARGDQTH